MFERIGRGGGRIYPDVNVLPGSRFRASPEVAIFCVARHMTSFSVYFERSARRSDLLPADTNSACKKYALV